MIASTAKQNQRLGVRQARAVAHGHSDAAG
jgi:hypothetical protein